jgi:hypothetical protein
MTKTGDKHSFKLKNTITGSGKKIFIIVVIRETLGKFWELRVDTPTFFANLKMITKLAFLFL